MVAPAKALTPHANFGCVRAMNGLPASWPMVSQTWHGKLSQEAKVQSKLALITLLRLALSPFSRCSSCHPSLSALRGSSKQRTFVCVLSLNQSDLRFHWFERLSCLHQSTFFHHGVPNFHRSRCSISCHSFGLCFRSSIEVECCCLLCMCFHMIGNGTASLPYENRAKEPISNV